MLAIYISLQISGSYSYNIKSIERPNILHHSKLNLYRKTLQKIEKHLSLISKCKKGMEFNSYKIKSRYVY